MALRLVLLSSTAIRSPAGGGVPAVLRRYSRAGALAGRSVHGTTAVPAAQGVHSYTGPPKVPRVADLDEAVSNLAKTASVMENSVSDIQKRLDAIEEAIHEAEQEEDPSDYEEEEDPGASDHEEPEEDPAGSSSGSSSSDHRGSVLRQCLGAILGGIGGYYFAYFLVSKPA